VSFRLYKEFSAHFYDAAYGVHAPTEWFFIPADNKNRFDRFFICMETTARNWLFAVQ
jgi:hypothetical protein